MSEPQPCLREAVASCLGGLHEVVEALRKRCLQDKPHDHAMLRRLDAIHATLGAAYDAQVASDVLPTCSECRQPCDADGYCDDCANAAVEAQCVSHGITRAEYIARILLADRPHLL